MNRKRLLLLISGIVVVTTVFLVSNDITKEMMRAIEKTYTLTLDGSNNKPSSYGTGSYFVYSTTNGKVEFSYSSLSSTNGYGSLAENGFLCNTDPINGLKKISVTFTNSLSVSYGYTISDYDYSSNLTSGVSFDFDDKLPSYFKISTTTGSVISSLSVTYTCVATPVSSSLARFEFGENGDASHSDGSKISSSYTETNNGYTLNISDVNNIYKNARDAKGNSCLKIGSNKALGSFSFNVPNDVSNVNFYLAGYKSNTAKVNINGNNTTITTLSSNGEYTLVAVDTSSTKTVSFTSVSGGFRAMLDAIEFIGASGSSSSQPSSSQPSTSEPSSEEVSSNEPSSSEPSSSQPSSSEPSSENPYYTGEYYNNITATSGNALLGQVRDLIVSTHTNYVSYSYSRGGTSGKTGLTDADPNKSGNIIMFYTKASITDMWDNGTTYNREHVWCQSKSGPTELWGESNGGADMHHIRPCFTSINSSRGNKLYAEVSNGTLKTQTYNGVTYQAGYFDNSYWEPLDDVKGDVARILLYLFTHYNSPSYLKANTNKSDTLTTSAKSEGSGDLPINYIVKGDKTTAFNLLVSWNVLDPVDEIEMNRNNEVYKIQGNRNPFIDHPEYVSAIWG